MTSPWLPNADSDRLVWLYNLKHKLPGYALPLNITADDVSQTAKDYDMFAYSISVCDLFKHSQQNATAFKKLLNHSAGQTIGSVPAAPDLGVPPAAVPAGIFDRARLLVQRIKNHAAYSEAIGQDLNIVSPVDTTDPNTIQPVLKHKLDVGRPHLKWARSIADAIDIYADHNDGNGFVLIGRFMKVDFLDTTALAPGKVTDDWKYKGIYVIADEQVGLMSEIITVRAAKQ